MTTTEKKKPGRPRNEDVGRPAYDQKEYHSQLMRDQSRKTADIGEIPAVVNPERKAECGKSLLKYLTTYFPNSTGLYPFSDDHVRVINRMEHCLISGGRHVNSVYRGFAKTTISELSSLWATKYGHRKCGLILGSAQSNADNILAGVLSELESNDLLFEDFPEVCYSTETSSSRLLTGLANGLP